MTLAVFHDFPGLENGLAKFHDFPGRVVTLVITYQVDGYRSGLIGTSLLCLGGHGLHCSSADLRLITLLYVCLRLCV